MAIGNNSFDSSSNKESSDEDLVILQESFCIRLTKVAEKTDSKSGEILISIVHGVVRKNYTCLLDTGTSQSLLNEKLADEKAVVKSKKKTSWETKGENFSTSKRVIVKDCKLPQFTSHRKFDGLFHLFNSMVPGPVNVAVTATFTGHFGLIFRFCCRYGNIY